MLAASGDYGVDGSTFGHSHGVFTFQAGVSVPIFTGGRIKGETLEARLEAAETLGSALVN